MLSDTLAIKRFIFLTGVLIYIGFLLVVPVIGTDNSTNMGAELYALEEFAEALQWYEEELTSLVGTDRAPVLNNIGSCYMGLLKNEEALDSFLAAVDANPDYATGWLNAGVAYEALDNSDKALVCFNNAIAADPDNAGKAFVMKGGLLAGLGESEEALKAYQQAEILTNGTLLSEALNGKGAIYFLQGMNEEANVAFLAAIEADSEGSPMARTNLGVLYVYEGRYDEARIAFKEAMVLDPLGKTEAAGYYEALHAMIDTNETNEAYEQTE